MNIFIHKNFPIYGMKQMYAIHSSSVYIASIVCKTVNGNLTVRNMLITYGILKVASNVSREIDEVREERLRRRGECDRLRKE